MKRHYSKKRSIQISGAAGFKLSHSNLQHRPINSADPSANSLVDLALLIQNLWDIFLREKFEFKDVSYIVVLIHCCTPSLAQLCGDITLYLVALLSFFPKKTFVTTIYSTFHVEPDEFIPV